MYQPFELELKCDECYEVCICTGEGDLSRQQDGSLAVVGTITASTGCAHSRRFLGPFEQVPAGAL